MKKYLISEDEIIEASKKAENDYKNGKTMMFKVGGKTIENLNSLLDKKLSNKNLPSVREQLKDL